MTCPMKAASQEVSGAVQRCPFLHAVQEFQGEEYACRLAVNPFAPAANPRTQPIFPEDAIASLKSVFTLFHGETGVIPLNSKTRETEALPQKSPMPSSSPSLSSASVEQELHRLVHPAAGMPMASISLSGFNFLPNPGDIFNRKRPHKQKQQRPKPKGQPGGTSGTGNPPAAGGGSGGGGRGGGSSHKPPGAAATGTPSIGAASPPPSGEGKCPLRRVFGPIESLLPLVVGSQMQCPPAIVAMRAAVAGLKPVRHLRPQALPIRSLGLAGTAIAANLPCGMWREHTKKFSPEWFVAVHATIPFVAMLRKAVLMPKWAILLTIAGAIAGQQVGAKLERARLQQQVKGSSKRSLGNSLGKIVSEPVGSLNRCAVSVSEKMGKMQMGALQQVGVA